jgi:uncharacterized protein YdaU (DUF1376 family)
MSKENNKRPSFQFYPSDWLSDPNVIAMTDRERGAYIQILATMWVTEDCSLRSDLEYLARLSGSDQEVIGFISHCFVDDGKVWRHKRLDYERNKQSKYFKTCSDAGKKGNEKRWGKPSKSGGDRSSSSSSSSSSPSSSSSEREADASTPSQVMRTFIESVKDKDNSYIDLVTSISENKNIQGQKVAAELDKFVGYWTELNKSGTKERWELERTFEVKRRLTTWFGRDKDFNSKPSILTID